MSYYYEQLGDYLASDTAHQGPCLTKADLAEEEADFKQAYKEPETECAFGQEYVRMPRVSLPEIGTIDSLSNEVVVAKRLVSLHYGHGGLAAGGRKRVDVD